MSAEPGFFFFFLEGGGVCGSRLAGVYPHVCEGIFIGEERDAG